jgi:hypothetical protein
MCRNLMTKWYQPDDHPKRDSTSGKRGFHPSPLVPKLFGSELKGALVLVRAAGYGQHPVPVRNGPLVPVVNTGRD